MTPAQLARRLGLTRDAVHKAIQRGRLLAEQRTDPYGKAYYWITEEDADRYAEAPKDRGGRPRKERKG